MWVPENAEEIERAAQGGHLRETHSFDAKAALPDRNRNAELAKDVSAMTVDGGVLLYGIAEDRDQNPTVPQPIDLAGVRERVDQIVSTSIQEQPYVDPRSFATADDPSKGYLVVLVPQSARAPHQVTVRGELRFYGRDETGNRILTEVRLRRSTNDARGGKSIVTLTYRRSSRSRRSRHRPGWATSTPSRARLRAIKGCGIERSWATDEASSTR